MGKPTGKSGNYMGGGMTTGWDTSGPELLKMIRKEFQGALSEAPAIEVAKLDALLSSAGTVTAEKRECVGMGYDLMELQAYVHGHRIFASCECDDGGEMFQSMR